MRFKDTFIFLVVVVVVLAFSIPVRAADTWDVCKSGCTYSTINSAIDAASTGDTVQVTDGSVYNENVDFDGLGITLQSTGGYATINGGGSAAGVSIVNATSGNVVLDGFTIINGAGVGVYVDNSSPFSLTNSTITSNSGPGIHIKNHSTFSNISNCTIVNNGSSSYGQGGGLRIEAAYPTLENCLIRSNYAYPSGGGIYFYATAPYISNCTIDNNESAYGGSGIFIDAGGYSQFINCLITRNTSSVGGNGSGINFDQNTANSSLINCTVSDNIGATSSIFYRSNSGGGHKIINSLIWGNEKGILNASSLTVTYSDIQGSWEGEGNIEDDPLFSAPEDDDFSLRCASPAKDAGTSDGAPADDLNGNSRPYSTTAVDMGAYEYQSTASCPVPSDLYVGDSEVYSTIQDAIDAAKDGDTIWVDTGTYYENIDFKGKDIKVISEDEERPEYTTIDGGTAGNVVTMATYEGLGTQLSGFTITEGSLTNGGGISLANFAMPSISNCIITGNTGDGIYMDHSYANITDSVITDNTDAGIEATFSNLTISNSFISENNDSGISASGDSDQHLSFSNCTIENNSNPSSGGGLRIKTSHPTLENCLIRSNYAYPSGGGIYFYATAPYISNCTIDNNKSAYGGSGIIIDAGGYSQFINCLITRNTSSVGGNGSGINFDQATENSSLINCTVSDNIGATSSIFYRSNSGGGHKIINSIVWGNEKEILNSSSLTITYSDIQSGWTGTGNIDVDPDFVNSAAGDYHLNASSSCINAGTTVNVFTDLDGNIRPIDFAYDMGAYEYNEITSDYGIISGYVMDYTNNPINSATVTLREYEAQGNVLATTTSNSDGYYEFNSLSNRVYIIDAEDGSLLNRRTGKTNKSLPWAMEEFINLYLNE